MSATATTNKEPSQGLKLITLRWAEANWEKVQLQVWGRGPGRVSDAIS